MDRLRLSGSGNQAPPGFEARDRISPLGGGERIRMYTTEELREMFAGCETAQNIINEQIGDVDGKAVWYPWDHERVRIPVTPEAIIREVQDAWDALALSREDEARELVDPGELAALQRIAEGRYELRAQYCADSATDEEE